ncbi:hypothetical protein [Pseudobacteroides cellulosolvens]|nr:hypothetical protein [Pseudobacteroides cellulosolvens]
MTSRPDLLRGRRWSYECSNVEDISNTEEALILWKRNLKQEPICARD